MKRPITITGLDIGSSKFCAVASETDSSGSSRIVGIETFPSRGIERGHVVDLNLAVDSASKVLDRLEEKASKKLENIYVNISGKSIAAQKARGMVSLSMRGREITEGDMKRCVNVASTIRLPFEREILHRIVHSYTIDDQTETKNPIGLYGSRLAVEIYVITASVNHIQNIQKVINNCGRELKEVVFSGMADSFSLFGPEDQNSNIILVDMGCCLTEVCMLQDGIMKHVEVIQLGASDIGTALDSDVSFDTMLSRIDEKAREFSAKGVRFKSAVITGGGSLLDGVIEAFERRLGIGVTSGSVKGLRGSLSAVEGVHASTAVGLVRYAEKYCVKPAGAQSGSLIRNISSKVVDIFNNYF